MGCLISRCSCIHYYWLKCTDYCYNTTPVKETEISTVYLCNYPYCHNLTNWNYKTKKSSSTEFIKFRNKIYCSPKCKEMHLQMNYGSIDSLSNQTQYADL